MRNQFHLFWKSKAGMGFMRLVRNQAMKHAWFHPRDEKSDMWERVIKSWIRIDGVRLEVRRATSKPAILKLTLNPAKAVFYGCDTT